MKLTLKAPFKKPFCSVIDHMISSEFSPPSRRSAALQYCNGVDWRQKLDSQRGAVLATELKNNSYKLARWTCCAMLAGSEYLKLG